MGALPAAVVPQGLSIFADPLRLPQVFFFTTTTTMIILPQNGFWQLSYSASRV